MFFEISEAKVNTNTKSLSQTQQTKKKNDFSITVLFHFFYDLIFENILTKRLNE